MACVFGRYGPRSIIAGAAMVALAAHLYHGVWSMFQTVGVVHPRYDRLRRTVATLVAIVVPVGFASIPLAIFFGLLR